MQIVLSLLAFIFLLIAVIGLLKPVWVLPFCSPEKASRPKALGLYLILFFLCVLLLPSVPSNQTKDESDAYLEQLKSEAKDARNEIAQKKNEAKQWYSGGSLHESNISEWKKASKANKIATAADWILVSPAIKEKAKMSNNLATIKPYALALVNCLDEATTGNAKIDQSKTSEHAVMCMVLLGYLE